jgi:Cysteine-rich CPCC
VCFWQDDIVQLRWPNFSGGANRPSLIDAQKNVSRLGAVEERLLPYVRPATEAEPMHPSWRPFDAARDVIEERRSGFDYGMTYADDGTTYYYWLDTGQ